MTLCKASVTGKVSNWTQAPDHRLSMRCKPWPKVLTGGREFLANSLVNCARVRKHWKKKKKRRSGFKVWLTIKWLPWPWISHLTCLCLVSPCSKWTFKGCFVREQNRLPIILITASTIEVSKSFCILCKFIVQDINQPCYYYCFQIPTI